MKKIIKILTVLASASALLMVPSRVMADVPDIAGIEVQKDTSSEADMEDVLRWAREAMLVEEGYEINVPATYGDTAEILWNMNGRPQTDSGNTSAQWATANGLIDADQADMDHEITYDQMIDVLWRTEGRPEPEGTSYKFSNIDGEYEVQDKWAADRHLILRGEQENYQGSAVCPRSDVLRYIYYLYHYRQPFAITKDELIQSAANVMEYARLNGYIYGDSHGYPPTSDGIISCDRLICKALWDASEEYQDQARGGGYMGMQQDWYGGYLDAHGFVKSYDISDMGYASIVEVKNGSGDFHTFLCLSYDPGTGYMERYDAGANAYIQTVQPLRGQFPYQFVCCWNIPEE